MYTIVEHIRHAFEDGMEAIAGVARQVRAGVVALLTWALSDRWVWFTFIYLVAFLILTL